MASFEGKFLVGLDSTRHCLLKLSRRQEKRNKALQLNIINFNRFDESSISIRHCSSIPWHRLKHEVSLPDAIPKHMYNTEYNSNPCYN